MYKLIYFIISLIIIMSVTVDVHVIFCTEFNITAGIYDVLIIFVMNIEMPESKLLMFTFITQYAL